MKEIIINKVQNHLQHELDNVMTAATNAHLAAVDDQSVAETQYDTLAIEASYLAEGHTRRIEQLKHDIAWLMNLNIIDTEYVSVGSLVQLEAECQCHHWFIILPVAAGFRGQVDNNTFTVITPHAPMGSSLMNKEEGEQVIINIGAKQIVDEISQIQ